MRSPAFQAWIHSMPKFNLVSRLCLPHCFTPIKNYHVAPIVHFPAEEKPNRIFYSDPFTARINIMHFAILKVFWYHPRLSMPFKENLLSSKLENANIMLYSDTLYFSRLNYRLNLLLSNYSDEKVNMMLSGDVGKTTVS